MGGVRAATGPDWEHPAVRPAMGARVAVHGYPEAQVSKLVVGMVGGKERAFPIGRCLTFEHNTQAFITDGCSPSGRCLTFEHKHKHLLPTDAPQARS